MRHDLTRLIGFCLVSAHPHHALHDGDELDELDPQVIAQEAVDFQRMIGVGMVDRHQGVELDSVLFQSVQAPDHTIEGGLAALVVAVGVVQRGRTVDAEAYQKVVLPKERGPFIVDQRAVGLDGVLNGHPGSEVFSLVCDRPAKEIQAHQRGLAALPGHDHLRYLVSFDELADIALQHLVRHAEAAARVEHLLGKEEAVVAVKVAGRAGRLGEQVKRRRRLGRECSGEGHIMPQTQNGDDPSTRLLRAQVQKAHRTRQEHAADMIRLLSAKDDMV